MKPILLSVALLLAACGGSGSGASAELQAAAQCSALGLDNLNTIFGEVSGFLSAIGGTLPPNVTFTAPDYVITLSSGTISGSVSSPDDISDGVDAGESVSASWNLTPLAGGTATGNGTFTLDRTTAFVFAIGGNGAVADGTCILNATGVDLSLDLSTSLGPVGSFDFNAVTPTGPITGTMNFDGSDVAVVEALYFGVAATFEIDLGDFSVHF